MTDVNDNSPVFNKSSYSADVREDAPVGTVLLQVRATDADGEPPRDTSPLACLQGRAASEDSAAAAVDELLGTGGGAQRSSVPGTGSPLPAVRLRYELAQHSTPEVSNLFQVNESTGEVSVRSPLDYDRGPRDFTFAVMAYDCMFCSGHSILVVTRKVT